MKAVKTVRKASGKVVRAKILLFLTAILVSIVAAQPKLYTSLKLSFEIYENGLVKVNYIVVLKSNMTLITEVPLMGSPYIEDNTAYIFVLDEKGLPVVFNLSQNTISVETLGVNSLNITYFTYDLTSKEKAIWKFEVNSPINFTVILPENVTIVGLSAVPIKIDTVDHHVVVVMPSGKQYIEYIPSIPKSSAPKKSSEKTSQKPSTEKKENIFPENIVLFIVPALAAVLVLAVFLVKRRSSIVLTEEEEVIVNALKRYGGRAYQFEIARELPFPKTTLWKYVRKLEEKGVIRIEKRGVQNYLILLKKI